MLQRGGLYPEGCARGPGFCLHVGSCGKAQPGLWQKAGVCQDHLARDDQTFKTLGVFDQQVDGGWPGFDCHRFGFVLKQPPGCACVGAWGKRIPFAWLAQLDAFSSGLSTAPLAAGQRVETPPTDPDPGPTDPPPVYIGRSVLERVLMAAGDIGTMAPLTGTFLNIAENVATLDPQTGAILNRIDGSVTNTMTGVSAATAEVTGEVLAISEVTMDLGDISTTVLGAVNTGTITLGVNQDLSEAISGTSGALSASMQQLGGTTDHAVLVANMASNMTSVVGSVSNSFDGLNGSIGNVSTTVLGAVNTGTVVSGVNETITGIVGG